MNLPENLQSCPDISTPIRCDLVIVRRDENPEYEALSYTWGDLKNRIIIFVNGQEFQATRNLHLALEHIRRNHIEVLLWIDALCINQNDDEEKGIQVKLMRHIYAQAVITIAWLGPSTNGTDLVMTEFQRLGPYIVGNGILDSMIELGCLSSDNHKRYQEPDAKIKEDLSDHFKEARNNLPRTLSLLEATQNWHCEITGIVSGYYRSLLSLQSCASSAARQRYHLNSFMEA